MLSVGLQVSRIPLRCDLKQETYPALKRWRQRPKGAQWRYTKNKAGDIIYVLTIGSPKAETITAGRLNSAEDVKIKEVSLLGYDGKITWRRDVKGMTITLPEKLPTEKSLAFEIVCE